MRYIPYVDTQTYKNFDSGKLRNGSYLLAVLPWIGATLFDMIADTLFFAEQAIMTFVDPKSVEEALNKNVPAINGKLDHEMEARHLKKPEGKLFALLVLVASPIIGIISALANSVERFHFLASGATGVINTVFPPPKSWAAKKADSAKEGAKSGYKRMGKLMDDGIDSIFGPSESEKEELYEDSNKDKGFFGAFFRSNGNSKQPEEFKDHSPKQKAEQEKKRAENAKVTKAMQQKYNYTPKNKK